MSSAPIEPPHEAIRRGRRLKVWLRRVLFYLVLLGGWEVLARFGPWPDYLFPGPLAVFGALRAGVVDGLFLAGAGVSLQRLALGYAISVVVGLTLGLLLGRVPVIRETAGSLVLGLQALPSVCWLPMAILWFGLNERAIIFVVVMGALFSVTLGVEAGIRNTPPHYLQAARNLGARGPSLVTRVIIPAALPSIVNGLKQGWTFAWRSLMAGELLYYTLSLGNLLQTGRDLNDAAQVMAVMALIVVIGVLIDQLVFAPIEHRLRASWGLGG